MDKLIAAFLGATLAFLFLRLADFLREVFKREERNFKTLIRYQHLFTSYQFITHKNIKMMDNYCKSKDPTKLDINFNVFNKYPIERELLHNLTNIDLVNEIFIINEVLFSLNHNLDTLSRVNKIMSQSMLNGNIDQNIYNRSIDGIKENINKRRKDLLENIQDVRSSIFTINYLIKNKPYFYKIINKLSNSRLSKEFIKDRKNQMEKEYKFLDEFKSNE